MSSRTLPPSADGDDARARQGPTTIGEAGPTVRLADKIRTSPIPALRTFLDAHARAASSDGDAPRVPVYVIDDVAERFYAGCPKDHGVGPSVLADLAPPRLFVEMLRPSRVVTAAGEPLPATVLPPAWGWLVESLRPEDVRALLAAAGLTAEVERRDRAWLRRLAESLRVDAEAVARAMDAADPAAACLRLGVPERAYLAAASHAAAVTPALGPETRGDAIGEPTRLASATLVAEAEGVVLPPLATVHYLLDRTGSALPSPLIRLLARGGDTESVGGELGAYILLLHLPVLRALPLRDRGEASLRTDEPAPRPSPTRGPRLARGRGRYDGPTAERGG